MFNYYSRLDSWRVHWVPPCGCPMGAPVILHIPTLHSTKIDLQPIDPKSLHARGASLHGNSAYLLFRVKWCHNLCHEITLPTTLTMIFTIGHSTHRIERFVELLKKHGITALADVRSSPYSRFNPQFNRESLKKTLRESGISYVFLGEELGARSKDRCCYDNGRVNYRKLAATQLFKSGLDRLATGASTFTVAMMCAEKEPLDCHRTILVARELESRDIPVTHILEDGSIESHSAAISRLKYQLQIPEHDMFRGDQELVDEAYTVQSERIAYVDDAGSKSDEPAHA